MRHHTQSVFIEGFLGVGLGEEELAGGGEGERVLSRATIWTMAYR